MKSDSISPETSRQAMARGFTLLEVLLAMGIFAIAVVSLLGALNQVGLAAMEGVEDQAVQHHLRSQLVELMRDPRLPAGTTETESEDGRFRFRREVRPLEQRNEAGKALDQLFELKVEALLLAPDGRREVVAEASSYRYLPLYLR